MRLPLYCLGASGEVGRSAFLLKTDKRIMLDYGIKIFDKSGKPQYPAEYRGEADFAIISHAHLDHSGFVPAFYRHSNVRWFATPPTRDICELLWQDSMKIMGAELPYNARHFKKALAGWRSALYGQEMGLGETTFTLQDAGHVAGAAIINLEYGGRKVCYTGDFKGEPTHMHGGAEPVEDVDFLVIETTYALKEHPDRKQLEARFIDEIRETLEEGGNVILPAFALGRTQELIRMVRSHDKEIPVYVDGMGREITRIYRRYSKYIKDPQGFKKDVNSVNIVSSVRQRIMATQEPSVIVTTAGMMSGGPVLSYLMHSLPNSKVIFTGYCMEDTNGWKLQNEGYVTINGEDLEVDLPVHYMDFSAHAGRKDILDFIKKANPEKTVLVHGDSCAEFREELATEHGFDAYAPKLGEKIEL